MTYYHDESRRTVYAVPEIPTVYLARGKKGDPGIWRVWMTIEVTRADNFINSKTKRPTHDLRYTVKDEYEEYRDSREQAIQYFKSSKYPNCEQIEAEQYFALRKHYEDESKSGPKNA